MHFRTDLKLDRSSWNIDYNSSIISIGSCFSTNIANRLEKFQFKILNNPYGTLYNPISIFRSITYEASDFKDTFIKRDGKWVSFLTHSDIANTDEMELEELLNYTSSTVKSKINECDYLILTIGSAKVYSHKNTNLIVANCHKRPKKEFDSRLLSINEIVDEFEKLITKVKTVNPDIRIILSVSPVRYLSDGFNLNSQNKAILILACKEIVERNKKIEYFPAYELILDDLRDYRFFENDLIHPNEMAVDYVFEKFSSVYFDDKTSDVMSKVQKINRSLNHIPFNRNSVGYIDFLNSVEKQISELEKDINTLPLKESIQKLRAI